jgi:hypothetical protein
MVTAREGPVNVHNSILMISVIMWEIVQTRLLVLKTSEVKGMQQVGASYCPLAMWC